MRIITGTERRRLRAQKEECATPEIEEAEVEVDRMVSERFRFTSLA
jgi:hypothetical protein